MHTVLIVEDEKMIRQGIKAMVQRSGVPVEVILECANGEMALEILKSQDVDVMFTDIRMPKMDGIQLVRAMQELSHKPLTVAISGYDDFSYAVQMLRAGIREYILKPVDREQIRQILERLEEELEQKREKIETKQAIGCQQLKYLIWDQNITEAERTAILREYGGGFFAEKYIVCCLDHRDGEMAAEEDFIYINHLGDSEAYIMRPEALERFQKQEWRRRYAGVSPVKQGLSHLKEAFEEARYARGEAFWTERHIVLYEETTEEGHEKTSDRGVSLETYVQMMGTDKAQQAVRQLGNLLWNARRRGSHEELERELMGFSGRLLETYGALLNTDSEEPEQLKEPCGYVSISEYEKHLMTWLKWFLSVLNRQFEDYKNKQKVQQAMLYIRENYDKDLNMAVVSNHISMNYSLFSYVFKQYTGKNFVNFLKDIRMEKAKELLETTDLRIVEVSQRVGYENEKHFMKLFKASCGVSPTEYRRNMQYRNQR